MKKRPVFLLTEVNEAAAYIESELRDQSARAHGRADQEKRREVRIKRELLGEVIQEASSLEILPKSVFVSLSAKLRKQNMAYIEKFCLEAGFTQVHTGFDDDVDGDIKLGVMFKIMECHAFLGVWSDDLPLKGREPQSVPGVWMPLELGMALVLHKPYYLLLHDKTHPSYLNPVVDFVQGRYVDQRSFDSEIQKAAKRLYEKAEVHLADEQD